MFSNTNRLIRKMLKRVKNDAFATNLFNKINYYLSVDDAEVETTSHSIRITCQDEQFLVTLESDGVSYEVKKESGSTKVHYEKYLSHKNGSIIKILDQDETIIDSDDRLFFDRISEEVFRLFDKNGIETSKRRSQRFDRYFEDKLTKEKTLCEPNPLQNYIENTYTWRAEGKYVIKRVIRTYSYPDKMKSSYSGINDSDNFLIRYQLLREGQRELPEGGNYYGIDSDVFFDYKKNNTGIDRVIENFKSKKYTIPRTIYF